MNSRRKEIFIGFFVRVAGQNKNKNKTIKDNTIKNKN
jgi:hypothetical protein